MSVGPNNLITPLNLPLGDYRQLCTDSVTNLPPIHMEPFLVTDHHAPMDDLTRAIFHLGFTAAQFRTQYVKYMGMSVLNASRVCASMVRVFPHTGPTHEADLLLAASKITIFWAPRLVVLPDSIMAEMHPLQKSWIDDHIYLVFGFSDRNVPFNQTVHDAIGTGLVMLDRGMIEADSPDHSAHGPLTVSAQAASDFQSIVGDAYKNRTATWHWTLSLLQIGISVCFRSLHQGHRPLSTWKRFTNSGAQHHVMFTGY
jgi:hypothetical protein